VASSQARKACWLELMDIVQELANRVKRRDLVGDQRVAVIDHENESAGQQQRPTSRKKNRGSCIHLISVARKMPPALTGPLKKFNLISTLSAFRAGLPVLGGPESVDACKARPL